jgi:UDP-glucose 4-epimerase
VNILLTGGTGYIGSHAAIALIEAGHQVVLLDNFSNSDASVLDRLKKIVGKTVPCIKGDVRDDGLVKSILTEHKIEAVMHFAGLKSVAESNTNPLLYFDNNVSGTVSLLKAMQHVNVKKLVFSSSACVYGDPVYLPYNESHPTNPMNAYGWSKLHIEQILKCVAESDSTWAMSCLRYFNPVGAHESGLIGEDPSGIPNNLMPYIMRVASGDLPELTIYGNDYDTIDGTGVRDYIHVMDLAEGHLSALMHLSTNSGFNIFNLGTGCGSSVLQAISAYEAASGKPLPHAFGPRRAGDLPMYFGDPKKAENELGWTAKRDLNQMCKDLYRWQTMGLEK